MCYCVLKTVMSLGHPERMVKQSAGSLSLFFPFVSLYHYRFSALFSTVSIFFFIYKHASRHSDVALMSLRVEIPHQSWCLSLFSASLSCGIRMSHRSADQAQGDIYNTEPPLARQPPPTFNIYCGHARPQRHGVRASELM